MANTGQRTECRHCGLKSTWSCPRCRMIWDIVNQAQMSSVLIVKNGEYYDFRGKAFFEYIDKRLKEFEREE